MGVYLAMTGAELKHCSQLPQKCAWMACHLSPGGNGLSYMPDAFPMQGLLCIDDSLLPDGHDPDRIAEQVRTLRERFSFDGIVLDFQRPFHRDLNILANKLQSALPCPVGITPQYEKDWNGALFLPPVPLNQAVADYLTPWKGRDLWLELSCERLCMALTTNGCVIQSTADSLQEPIFRENTLHCHYNIRLAENVALFTLERAQEDMAELIADAMPYGVAKAIGLYQEFGSICPLSHIQWDRPKYKEAGYE